MKLLNAELYIRSMGKLLEITDLFLVGEEGTKEANRAMEQNQNLALVAEVDGLLFLASKYDRGFKFLGEER